MNRRLFIIGLIIAIVIISGCVSAESSYINTHAHRIWTEKISTGYMEQSITKFYIPEDNVTCYALISSALNGGAGISCISGG